LGETPLILKSNINREQQEGRGAKERGVTKSRAESRRRGKKK
jgi:hypothetical protein